MSAELVDVEVLAQDALVAGDAAGHRPDQAGAPGQLTRSLHRKSSSYTDPFEFDPTGNALYTQDQHPICKSRMRRLDSLPPLRAPIEVAKKAAAG